MEAFQARDVMDQVRRVSRKKEETEIKNNWNVLRKAGYIRNGINIDLTDLDWIKGAWKDKPCFVIGGSPALKNMVDEGFTFDMLDNYNTIGCNHLIEDYDKLKWHLFLDNEFLQKTKYDMKNYKGVLFCRNNVNLFNGDLPFKINRFLARNLNQGVDDDLNGKGLYCNIQSGAAILHLAVMSGANPIYMVGLDTGGVNANKQMHYKPDYTGERDRPHTVYTDHEKRNRLYEPFLPWKDRIINLDTKGVIRHFKKMDWKEVLKQDSFFEEEKKITDIKQNPVICHVSRFQNKDILNEVSRQIFKHTEGQHIYGNIMEPVPKADIYLLECIINEHNRFINFQKPAGSKVISLVHSITPCLPAVCSDKVIVLSQAEKDRMIKHGLGNKTDVIHCAIEMKYYTHEVDYSKKTYGRITRYSPGKVNPKFHDIVSQIKLKVPESQCIFITKCKDRNPNIRYIENIESPDNEGKAKALSEMTLFTDYHGRFIETFSISLLEGMAAGLYPILLSPAPQLSMIEVIGSAGKVCQTEKEFLDIIIKLLPDKEAKKELGLKAKKRAAEFSLEKMISAYNKVFQEVIE